MKLHLCCGNVYLNGWINVDKWIDSDTTKYAKDHSDLVEQYGTTVENYYKFPFNENPNPKLRLIDYACDLRSDFPVTDQDVVDNIMMIQAIEHFTRSEAKRILQKCHESLIECGKLVLDWPDVYESARLIDNGEDEKAMRYIYCSGKDEYSLHKWGYTFEMMRDLLINEIGFRMISEYNEIKHDYPTLGAIAIK